MGKDTPAFPVAPSIWDTAGNVSHAPHEGLTKRQWYAGMALAGMAAGGGSPQNIATACFYIADAMIAHEESE